MKRSIHPHILNGYSVSAVTVLATTIPRWMPGEEIRIEINHDSIDMPPIYMLFLRKGTNSNTALMGISTTENTILTVATTRRMTNHGSKFIKEFFK